MFIRVMVLLCGLSIAACGGGGGGGDDGDQPRLTATPILTATLLRLSGLPGVDHQRSERAREREPGRRRGLRLPLLRFDRVRLEVGDVAEQLAGPG